EREIIALKKLGIRHACINAAGDVKVIGKRGDQPWQITIPDPRENNMLAALDVFDGESVFTTKDNDHFYEYKGMRYHHVLDPRTGYPADRTMLVTVIHPDAMTAAAATTALVVAGPDEWRTIAGRMGITYVMLIDKQGRIHLTPAMAKRVRFYQQPDKIEISPSLEANT
ncbi:MAG: FAD:protein FMN transferase, partial [Halobacteria archaeon]|nr:FAD:protein FMN transferase [Halobacteria archaeon]